MVHFKSMCMDETLIINKCVTDSKAIQSSTVLCGYFYYDVQDGSNF